MTMSAASNNSNSNQTPTPTPLPEYANMSLEERIKMLEASKLPSFEDEMREVEAILCTITSANYVLGTAERIKLMQFMQKYKSIDFVIITRGQDRIVGFASVQSMTLLDKESAHFWEKFPHTQLTTNHISGFISKKDGQPNQPFHSIYDLLNHPTNLHMYVHPKDQCSEKNCKCATGECSGFTLAEFKKFAAMMDLYKSM